MCCAMRPRAMGSRRADVAASEGASDAERRGRSGASRRDGRAQRWDALAESLAEASVPFLNNGGSKAELIHGIDVVLSIAVMLVKNSTSDVTRTTSLACSAGACARCGRSFEEHGTRNERRRRCSPVRMSSHAPLRARPTVAEMGARAWRDGPRFRVGARR